VFASEPPDSSQHRGRYLQFFLASSLFLVGAVTPR
jgi:hypothetical protein